jgi:hypothetical protein
VKKNRSMALLQKNIPDILRAMERLKDTQGEIDDILTRMNILESLVAITRHSYDPQIRAIDVTHDCFNANVTSLRKLGKSQQARFLSLIKEVTDYLKKLHAAKSDRARKKLRSVFIQSRRRSKRTEPRQGEQMAIYE